MKWFLIEMFNDIILEDNEIYLQIYESSGADNDNPAVYRFNVVRKTDGIIVGQCSFRVGGAENRHIKYGGNIGFYIDEPYRGKKYSLKACVLMTRMAVLHKMEFVYITCDPDNIASRRICELFGAKFVQILSLPEDDYNYINHGRRRHCLYVYAVI
jgi:tagatose 1,6-diphosphate aldolase